MKRGFKIAAWAVGGILPFAAAVSIANAATSANPYQIIAQRNVFNLHDPPPFTNEPPPPPPPSNVKLTGITSMLGVKRAFFMVSPPAERGKPPGKEQSFIMIEGEHQGVIEVLKIDEKAATVTIKNDGLESVLALDTPKLPNGPHPGPSPPGPPQPGMANGPHVRPSPDRPNGEGGRRRQSAELDPAPNATPVQSSQTPNIQGASNPDQSQSPSLAGAQPSQQADMPLEQKLLLTEIERQRMQPLIDQGLYPPIPDALGLQSQQPGNQGNDAAAGK